MRFCASEASSGASLLARECGQRAGAEARLIGRTLGASNGFAGALGEDWRPSPPRAQVLLRARRRCAVDTWPKCTLLAHAESQDVAKRTHVRANM